MPHLSQLDPEFSPMLLFKQLRVQWRARPHGQPKKPRELFKACLKAWKKYILPIILARLAVTALNFAQPFLLRQIITMVGKKNDEPHATAKRVGLLGASVFVFFGLPIARTYFGHLMNRYITRVRSGLISLLFHKVHLIPEQEAKKAAAPTLMGADVDGIAGGVSDCLDIPFGVLEIGLGIYVLSGFIKVASLAVFGPVIVFSVMTYIIGQAMAVRLANWNGSIEGRIAKTSHILPQLMGIKTLGLGPTVSQYLKQLRVDEVDVAKRFRRLQAVSMVPVLLADMMTSVVVIAAALFGSAFQGHMSAAKVFPVLTVVSLIQTPLAAVLHAYPTITSMLACFTRIENFLRSMERKDSRIHLKPAVISEETRRHAANQESLIRFYQADIAKKGMQEPLLRGVNFQIPPNSTTAVIGPTGSGKSALVDSILGNGEILGGSVEVDTSDIAYCGQTVWLRDASIRDNIVGHEKYNAERFRRVIRACFLEEDLAWLTGGADYIVGTNGRNLSGGQRQRVALARAVYKARKITLLDDVFSSLDRHTAICILHQLCGRNGIFEEAGCTVILITYLPQCVDVCRNAIFFDGKGRSILGTTQANSPLANQVMAILNDVNVSVRTAVEDKEQDAVRRSLQSDTPSVGHQEDDDRRKGDRRIYRLFIGPIGRLNALMYGVLVSVFSAGETMPDIYVRIWIELHPDDALYFVGYIGVVMATCFIGSLSSWVLHTKLAPRASISLHSDLVDKTMGSTLGFLSSTKTGYLLNLYSQDMLLISRSLPVGIFNTIYAGAYVFVQIGVILSGASYLAVVLPAILVVLYFIQHYYLRTSRQVRHLDLEMKAPLYTFFEETATGLSHIQAFKWESKNMKYALALLEEAQKPSYLMLAIQQWLALVLGFVTGSVGVSLVALALFVRHGSSETSIGLSFIALMALSRTMEATIISWTGLETTTGALSRLFRFQTTTPQEVKVSRQELPAHWPSSGAISFREVTARYKPESDDAPALDNVTMYVAPGDRIGIAGRSGSGKSSILLTLLGFINYEGAVEIDGVDVSSISRTELRSRLVTITQDQVQFQGTIRMNLCPLTMNAAQQSSVQEGEKALLRDAALERLLKSMHIWAQLASKGGLDAILENVGYSKGELQLLCIARAIVKQGDTKSRVVLVDEATSSVDAGTEKIVNRVMKEYFRNCTVISIGHRRSSVRNVNCLIEMYEGAIVSLEDMDSDAEPLPDSPHSSD
ncbi:ABC multidrug transporter [Cordyceps javanica]|uniref:ABC multidrug transporter n=1 Tax=Cordyceps javanica TaxID=43265 RepID=A0A545VIP9_9HYPO|nr:ABC multidrug transporter [Cordyceps javanica]TQW01602.1 ABC multidrug transporter [Cordyceps javanica]